MTTSVELQLRRDLIKLGCLVASILGTTAVFVITPALTYPTLLSLVATTLLTPGVSFLERKGYSKISAISLIFLALLLFTVFLGLWAIQIGLSEWNSFKEQAPAFFRAIVEKMTSLESELKSRYSFLNSIHPTNNIIKWGQDTGRWFVYHGTSLMGGFLTWIFIIPPLTFVLLLEGRTIQRRFFSLVPNRFFESFFMITSSITNSITNYIRAKILEAFLVGLMVTLGLGLLKAPYAIVLGSVAGVTNILPYLGPLLGAAPALLVIAVQNPEHTMLIPIILVYLIANIIDTFVIFPVIVAKLVNLHPLLLISVVAVGQEYYGLVGMLISIPIATALKVVLQEIYIAVYESR